jgi:hypothetical protein
MSDVSQGDGWLQASDGKWYAPQVQPDPVASTSDISPESDAAAEDDAEGGGEGEFGNGVDLPLYQFTASRSNSGRMSSPNVIHVWSDRIEEVEHHALQKKNSNVINFHQVAQVTMSKGMRWADMVVESTDGHVIALKGVPKADGERVKSIIDDAVHGAKVGHAVAAAAPQASVASATSMTDELLKLVQLRDAGALSDGEFEAQKQRIMKLHS